MVIVEGSDNTGKTRLIEFLACNSIGLKVIKSPGPQSAEFLATWCLTMFKEDLIRPLIFDRFPVISEMVYGPMFRVRDVLQEFGEGCFRDILKDSQPLIIYCRPHIGKIMDLGDREQMKGVRENISILVDKYDYEIDLMRKEGFAIIEYDFNHRAFGKDEILGLVRSHFERRGFRI